MSAPVTIHPLRVGSCRHLERFANRDGRWRPVTFPAYCMLISHPARGWILFDTGYARRFFPVTRRLPERLYRALLPVTLPEEEELAVQLRRYGIEPRDVGTVIISHYHADHIAGLRDFTNARFVAPSGDTHALWSTDNAWRNTARGLLPALLPDDFTSRVSVAESFPVVELPAWMMPFTIGFDLFGDGSAVAVPLPGHSEGQIGLLLPDAQGRPVFLVADACWSMSACRAGSLPSRIASLAHADGRRYAQTFFQLRELDSRERSLSLLPAHCTDSWEAFSSAPR
ncbi:MAG TPA: MBL fold metallo-hydrolase [Candidatus Acidoferrales bacterium]|nr:MBL fold metallo-hydrolase [Candidatus Acidoferrales bacterium]